MLFWTLTVPASATTYPTWMDYDGQIGGAPYDHYVFWKTYFYAMQPDSGSLKKGIRWSADSLIWTYTWNAMNNWNLWKPAGMASMADDPVNPDLRLYYTGCPGVPAAAGCFVHTGFTTSSVLNVRMWTTASIYIRYGYDWTTSSLIGVLMHEIGHGLGFEDQYSYFGADCNVDYYGLMDTVFKDAQNYWTNCDVPWATPAEIALWQNFWISGSYEWYSLYIDGDGKMRAYWRDKAWNDAVPHTMYKWSNSQNGTYTTFAHSYLPGRNGSHWDITQYWADYQFDEIFPYQLGITNKWIKFCRQPIFNYTGATGTETCSTPLYYQW